MLSFANTCSKVALFGIVQSVLADSVKCLIQITFCKEVCHIQVHIQIVAAVHGTEINGLVLVLRVIAQEGGAQMLDGEACYFSM